ELRDPGAVAQVDEDEAAVVAPPRRPAGEGLPRAGVLLTEVAAHKCPPAHADSLPTRSARSTGSSASPDRRSEAPSAPTTTVVAAPSRPAWVSWPFSDRPA